MKELTYLHCQCFSISNIVNNLLTYMQINQGMPAIFVILDSNAQDKRISTDTIRKVMAKKINLHAIIISDC